MLKPGNEDKEPMERDRPDQSGQVNPAGSQSPQPTREVDRQERPVEPSPVDPVPGNPATGNPPEPAPGNTPTPQQKGTDPKDEQKVNVRRELDGEDDGDEDDGDEEKPKAERRKSAAEKKKAESDRAERLRSRVDEVMAGPHTAEGKKLSEREIMDDKVVPGEDTPGLDEADATHVAAGAKLVKEAREMEPAFSSPGIASPIVKGVLHEDEKASDVQPGYYVVDSTTYGLKFREGPFPSSPSADGHLQAHYEGSLQSGLVVAQYGSPTAPGKLSKDEYPPREGFANPNYEPPVEDVKPREAAKAAGLA